MDKVGQMCTNYDEHCMLWYLVGDANELRFDAGFWRCPICKFELLKQTVREVTNE